MPDPIPPDASESDSPAAQVRTAGLIFIFITILIDVLGFGVIIPVLPRLVETMAGGGSSVAAHWLGLLQSSFGLMQLLFAPILGGLGDRFGRRPVLIVSLFFTAVDYIIMALAPTVGWLFLGRVLAGATGASYTTATAYIADVSPPEKRAQNFGIIGAAFGVGFILGPAAGGLLGAISLRLPFWVAAGLGAANALYGLFAVPESLKPENRSKRFDIKTANPIGGLGVLGRFPWVLAMAGALLIIGLAQQSLQSIWVLYTTLKFNWSALENGLSLTMIGACSIVIQMVVLRFAVKTLGETRTLMAGLIFNAAGFLCFALCAHGWQMYPSMLLWSLSFVAGPTTQSLISTQYGSDEQGVVQGALSSLQSLNGVIGPLLATSVFGLFTGPNAPVQFPGASFLLGAVLILGASALAYRALRMRSAGMSTD